MEWPSKEHSLGCIATQSYQSRGFKRITKQRNVGRRSSHGGVCSGHRRARIGDI
jgi:hypothetical protein